MIELAPCYFRYMDATASKPTVLAKLIGFYTVEIRNLETGAVQSKADLLVMENLFFDQNISKTFDLKGIQGRKVKTHGNHTKTLFDGEWIEGQPILVFIGLWIEMSNVFNIDRATADIDARSTSFQGHTSRRSQK